MAVDILLNERKTGYPNFERYKNDLEYREKAIITRLFKVMTKVLYSSKAELELALQSTNVNQDYRKYLLSIWDNFNFNRTLNNYTFVKFYYDKSQAYYKDETYFLENKNNNADSNLVHLIGNFAKLDWKVEVTLSSIWMKKVFLNLFFLNEMFFKVLRPMILLIFYTTEGQKKSFYLDIYVFQDLKKNIAIMLRNIHQVEYK